MRCSQSSTCLELTSPICSSRGAGLKPRIGKDSAHSREKSGAMLELIIHGGDVVTPQGVATCDVAIAGESIAAIAAPGVLSAQSAKRVIDATQRIVMPGGIDPHVHLH